VRLRSGDPDLAVEHLEAAARLDPIRTRPPGLSGPSWEWRASIRVGSPRRSLLKERSSSRTTPRSCYARPRRQRRTPWENLAAALAALTRYRSLTQVPIEDFARGYSRDPAHSSCSLTGSPWWRARERPETDSAGPSGRERGLRPPTSARTWRRLGGWWRACARRGSASGGTRTFRPTRPGRRPSRRPWRRPSSSSSPGRRPRWPAKRQGRGRAGRRTQGRLLQVFVEPCDPPLFLRRASGG